MLTSAVVEEFHGEKCESLFVRLELFELDTRWTLRGSAVSPECYKRAKDFPWSSVGVLNRGFLLRPVKSATSFLQIISHMYRVHIRKCAFVGTVVCDWIKTERQYFFNFFLSCFTYLDSRWNTRGLSSVRQGDALWIGRGKQDSGLNIRSKEV